MGWNCYKNNELYGVFIRILNGVAVHLINFVSTRGGGQGHALSEFSNEFFKPFHYRMAGSIQSDLDQPNLSLTYW